MLNLTIKCEQSRGSRAHVDKTVCGHMGQCTSKYESTLTLWGKG
jgi:hypothetical protein